MARKKNLRFYVKDIKSLEFQEIRRVLKEQHYIPYKLDINQGTEVLTDKLNKLKEQCVVVFIGWQLG